MLSIIVDTERKATHNQTKTAPVGAVSDMLCIYKPNSVVDNHLSGPCVATKLKRHSLSRRSYVIAQADPSSLLHSFDETKHGLAPR